jgi:glycogen debranching enzyme
MLRRLVEYPQGEAIGQVHLVDEERLLPDTATFSDLKPPSLTPEQSLLLLNMLPEDASTDDLGRNGPLLASATDAANAANPLAGAYQDRYARDSLESVAAVASVYPALDRATNLFWLQHLGRRDDPATHEQPWRTPHRIHEPARGGRTRLPGDDADMEAPSFSSVDATPLTILSTLRQLQLHPELGSELITHYTGETTYTYAEALAGQLELVRSWRRENAEGVIEAHAYSGTYKSFPFWKDSPIAYVHADGTLASPPVSTVEVVGYAYDAFAGAAALAEAHPELGLNADGLRAEAADIRAGLLEHYWLAERGHFALGTDRDPATGALRPLTPKASNMGRLLNGGILEGEEYRPYREAIVRTLFSPEMACPAGFLTLARDEVLFGPNRYHNGPPWIHDTEAIAQGIGATYPALAALAYQVVVRACREFHPEFLPATDEPNPKPNGWNVRMERPNVYGELIRPTVEKSPTPLQAWAVTAHVSAERQLRLMRTLGRTRATDKRDRAFEQDLLPSARAVFALPAAATRAGATDTVPGRARVAPTRPPRPGTHR